MLSSNLHPYEKCFCTVDTKPLDACVVCMNDMAHAFSFVKNTTARMCMFAECLRNPPCPFCMGNTTGPGMLKRNIRLVAFHRCPQHMEKLTREAVCPCGRLWAECRDCKGLDPRAGKNFCGFCGQERSSCTHQQELHDGLRMARKSKSTDEQKRQVGNFPFLMERWAVHREVAMHKQDCQQILSHAETLLLTGNVVGISIPPKTASIPMNVLHPSKKLKQSKFPRVSLESIQEEEEEETVKSPVCKKSRVETTTTETKEDDDLSMLDTPSLLVLEACREVS
jgi:hypothetical protein